MNLSNPPTPYHDVNTILIRLQNDAKAILRHHYVGMYLYGSLSSGDFNPYASDIDFLFVTDAPLPEKVIEQLKEMHDQIGKIDSKWAKKLEGSYIDQQALKRFDPKRDKHPSIGVDWEFCLGDHGLGWVIQRHIVREWGVVIEGPDPKTLIDPVSVKDLQDAVLDTLERWWLPMLDDVSSIRDSEYQAYAILTMCRVRYTMVHGTIVSKPVAAKWMMDGISNRWVSLIEQAVRWQHGQEIDRVDDTVELIRETCEVCL